MKHTPGPWSFSGTSILDKGGFVIADVDEVNAVLNNWQNLNIRHWSEQPGRSYRDLRDGEGEANAALISACPAMYEALKAMINAHSDEEKGCKLSWSDLESARAAIAKAEGGL